MSRHAERKSNEVKYQTHDGRLISRQEIERAVLQSEAGRRRQAHWEWVRTWAIPVVILVLLLAISAWIVLSH
jgi:hypothetical protein